MPTDPKRDDSQMSMGAINRELDALKDKTDQASCDRADELFDMLLNADMGMGPARRAMCQRQPPADTSHQETNQEEPHK